MGKSGFAFLSDPFTTPSRMLTKLRFDKVSWEYFSFLYIRTGNKGISKGQTVADDGILWRVFGPIHLFPANIYLFKVSKRNTRKKVWNMYKANNKDARTTSVTSFWYLYCQLCTHFTDVSIVDFEQENYLLSCRLIYYKSRHFSQKISD